MLSRVLETWGELSLRLPGKIISYCWCEKLSKVSNNDNNQTLCWLKEKKEFAVRWIQPYLRKNGQILGSCLRAKKLWHMRMTVIPIVDGALGIVAKGLENRLEELEIRKRIETISTTALFRSARILRRVLETWGNLQSLTPMKHNQLTLKWRTHKE